MDDKQENQQAYIDLPLQEGQKNEKDGPAGKGLMNQHSAVPGSTGRGRKRKKADDPGPTS